MNLFKAVQHFNESVASSVFIGRFKMSVRKSFIIVFCFSLILLILFCHQERKIKMLFPVHKTADGCCKFFFLIKLISWVNPTKACFTSFQILFIKLAYLQQIKSKLIYATAKLNSKKQKNNALTSKKKFGLAPGVNTFSAR